MPEPVSPQEAAALLEAADTLGIPLGTGQPPALMAALGERDDWTDLRIYGALLLAWSEAFKHPRVHYLSGFFGPVERALRDQGANISFAPADFRRFAPLLEEQAPRVMATVAAPPDDDGWCSLSLHAGGTLARAASRRRRPGARCSSSRPRRGFPRTFGLPPEYRARDPRRRRSTSWSSPTPSRSSLPDPPPAEVDAAIAEHARALHRRRRDAADRDRRHPVDDRGPARRAATAATTASTRRCSRPGSCSCTRPARSRTARASSTACPSPRSPPAPPSSTTGCDGQPRRRLPPGRGRQLARPDRRATG